MRMTVSRSIRVPLTVPLVRAAAEALVEKAAFVAMESGKDIIAHAEGSGTHWPALPQRSSSPGEHPVSQFGDLMESLKTRPGDVPVSHEMYSDDPNMQNLEEGTNRMAPRPFFTEASHAGELVMRESEPMLRAIMERV